MNISAFRPVRIAALVLIASSLARPALANDPDAAKKLFDAGLEQFEAGRFNAACPALEKSYQLDPWPGTLFTLAECEAKWGRLATAVRRYEEYLALYATLAHDKRQKQGDREKVSREARDALLPHVPEITMSLPPGASQDTRVTYDGAPLAASALGVAMRVDPGEHVFAAQAPGGPLTETRVSLNRDEKRVILLEVLPAAPSPDAVLPPLPQPFERPVTERHITGRRVGAFVSGGAGAVSVVIGAVAGGLAIGKKSAVDENCGPRAGFTDPLACTHAGKTAADSLSGLGLISTVGFVVGAAGLAGGAVLFLTDPKPKGATAAPRVLRVGFLSAGSTGGVWGIAGTWY